MVVEARVPSVNVLGLHARRHLKRGTYQVLVTPGASLSQLGATTTRTVRIR